MKKTYELTLITPKFQHTYTYDSFDRIVGDWALSGISIMDLIYDGVTPYGSEVSFLEIEEIEEYE